MTETSAAFIVEQDRVWLPAKEAARLLGISKAAFHKNRRAGRYITVVTHENGGDQYKVLRSSLQISPQTDCPNILSAANRPTADGNKLPDTFSSGLSANFMVEERADDPLPAHPSLSMIPEKMKAIALARFDLVTAWREHRRNCGTPKELSKADESFEKAYNTGFLLPSIFETLGETSMRSIKRWRQDLEGSSDWTLLVPKWSCEKKEPSLGSREKEIFKKLFLTPNRLTIAEATAYTIAIVYKEGIETSSPRTYRRWAQWFVGKNSALCTFIREGQKALRDEEIFSITRDVSKLEVGDVLVADGHRLNIQVKNPFTGKTCRPALVGFFDWKSGNLVGYEIMLEENVQCIFSALRNAVIRLGKTPKIVYLDNGKAWKSKVFNNGIDFEQEGVRGIFGSLEIEVVFAAPYNARAKVIERFFKELAKFERLQPSFIGTSIEDKPAWTKRNESFHKKAHNNHIPTVEEALMKLDTWIKEWWEKTRCPHMKDKSIGEAFDEGRGPGVNETDLDELMLVTEVKTIRANGVRLFGADYYADALFGLRERVYVKYSYRNLSYVRIYDMNRRFLCTGERVVPVHPMARYLGEAKDVEELKYKRRRQRALERSVVNAAKEIIAQNNPLPAILDELPMSQQAVQKLEQTKSEASLSEEEERHIPDYMLKKKSLPASTAPESEDEPTERPAFFANECVRYEWHREHGLETEEDWKFAEKFENTSIYFRTIYPEEKRLTKTPCLTGTILSQ